MPKHITFASLAHATKKKVTRREKFLAEMEVVVPWSRLLALIEPHYPRKGSKGVPRFSYLRLPSQQPSCSGSNLMSLKPKW